MALENVTGFNSMSTISSGFNLGLVAILIFIVIIVMLFCLFKNFRRFLTGLIILIPLGIIGRISYSISKATGEGSYTPIISFGCIVVGIIVCIGLGMLIEKFKWYKEFVGNISFEEDKPKVKKK